MHSLSHCQHIPHQNGTFIRPMNPWTQHNHSKSVVYIKFTLRIVHSTFGLNLDKYIMTYLCHSYHTEQLQCPNIIKFWQSRWSSKVISQFCLPRTLVWGLLNEPTRYYRYYRYYNLAKQWPQMSSDQFLLRLVAVFDFENLEYFLKRQNLYVPNSLPFSLWWDGIYLQHCHFYIQLKFLSTVQAILCKSGGVIM